MPLQLLWILAGLSLLGFGGGSAIIPQMQHEVVSRYHWLTAAQFTQYYAISRLAPGPTSMVSSLVGYQLGGFGGAALATAALFFPGSIVVGIAGKIWGKMSGSPLRFALSSGLGPVVVGLSWAAAVAIAQGAIDSIATIAIFAAATVAMLWTNMSVPLMILLGAVAGVVFLR